MIVDGIERNYFKRYVPGYCEGVEPLEFCFDSLEELLSNEWIDGWTKHPLIFEEPKPSNPNFYRFSLSENRLMCELKGGKEWWVVGYIKFPNRLNLPKWEPDREIEINQ